MIRMHVLAALSLISGIACSKTTGDEIVPPSAPPDTAVGTLTVTSTAFSFGGPIPSRFTCEGDQASPPLAWSDAPAATKSFALVVEDPDAPDPAAANRKTFVHWVVYDVPPQTRSVSDGGEAALPSARFGENDFGKAGYGGPCPPSGRHRYLFKLYALDVMLPDLGKAHAADLARAMSGHVLAEGQLVGTYEKGHGSKT